MQITNSPAEKFSRIKSLEQTKKNETVVFENAIISYKDSFVSVCLDKSFSGVSKFNVRGFYLDSSVDERIKSLPMFSMTLQRHDAKETYVTCFYAATYPDLFERFNIVKNRPGDNFFFSTDFSTSRWLPDIPSIGT